MPDTDVQSLRWTATFLDELTPALAVTHSKAGATWDLMAEKFGEGSEVITTSLKDAKAGILDVMSVTSGAGHAGLWDFNASLLQSADLLSALEVEASKSMEALSPAKVAAAADAFVEARGGVEGLIDQLNLMGTESVDLMAESVRGMGATFGPAMGENMKAGVIGALTNLDANKLQEFHQALFGEEMSAEMRDALLSGAEGAKGEIARQLVGEFQDTLSTTEYGFEGGGLDQLVSVADAIGESSKGLLGVVKDAGGIMSDAVSMLGGTDKLAAELSYLAVESPGVFADAVGTLRKMSGGVLGPELQDVVNKAVLEGGVTAYKVLGDRLTGEPLPVEMVTSFQTSGEAGKMGAASAVTGTKATVKSDGLGFGMGKMLGGLTTAFKGLFAGFGPAALAVKALTVMLEPFMETMNSMVDGLLAPLQEVGAVLSQLLMPLFAGLSAIMEPIVDILVMLAEIVVALLMPAMKMIEVNMKLIGLAFKLVALILKPLMPFIELFGMVIEALFAPIIAAIDWFSELLTAMGDFFSFQWMLDILPGWAKSLLGIGGEEEGGGEEGGGGGGDLGYLGPGFSVTAAPSDEVLASGDYAEAVSPQGRIDGLMANAPGLIQQTGLTESMFSEGTDRTARMAMEQAKERRNAELQQEQTDQVAAAVKDSALNPEQLAESLLTVDDVVGSRVGFGSLA